MSVSMSRTNGRTVPPYFARQEALSPGSEAVAAGRNDGVTRHRQLRGPVFVCACCPTPCLPVFGTDAGRSTRVRPHSNHDCRVRRRALTSIKRAASYLSSRRRGKLLSSEGARMMTAEWNLATIRQNNRLSGLTCRPSHVLDTADFAFFSFVFAL